MTEQAGAPRPGCPADSGDVATDAELCRRARRGQQPAFEELRRRHVQPAWRLAQTLIADGDDADRAAREAFIRAIRAGGRSEVAAEPFQTRLLASVYRHAVEDRHPTARPAMGAIGPAMATSMAPQPSGPRINGWATPSRHCPNGGGPHFG